MNYEEALTYIHAAGWQVGTPGTERIGKLLCAMGNPQNKLRFVHVAGTNGKGSVCAMLDSVLRAAGYHTGLFTSPFIRIFNERIQTDGVPISDGDLAELTGYVKSVADSTGEAYSEFELITAIGFAYFYRRKVDIVVLEVGLGGRFDPTNIIEKSVLSVITGIDFDHTALLGNTIQKIAAEKAGIIKRGCPCLYGGTQESAGRVISAVASRRGAPLYLVKRELFCLQSATLDGTVFHYGNLENIRLNLLGIYQIANVQTVMSAIEILSQNGYPVSEEALRRGLDTVTWAARFEKLSENPLIIYDGSHNPQGVKVLVRSIKTYFSDERVNILCGVMADKDYDEMAERLKSVANGVFTISAGTPRALGAEELAACFNSRGIPAKAYQNIKRGVYAAVHESIVQNIPLICMGSLYLFAPVSEAVHLALAEMI